MIEPEVVQADVTTLDVDAITNAANTQLRHGGGVAAAIARAAGPELQRESNEKAPIGLGEAVETTAGDMPAHCARPTNLAAAPWPWWHSGPGLEAFRSMKRPG